MSNEGKHTPGPWNLQLGTAGDWRVDRSTSEWNICGRLSTVEHMERESFANAHLIAAAPDLLEALEDARAQLEAYEEELSGEHFNDTRINAAIAKAKGEDQ